MLNLSLNDVSLDYIFDALNLKNVVFGGQATGDFHHLRFTERNSPTQYEKILCQRFFLQSRQIRRPELIQSMGQRE